MFKDCVVNVDSVDASCRFQLEHEWWSRPQWLLSRSALLRSCHSLLRLALPTRSLSKRRRRRHGVSPTADGRRYRRPIPEGPKSRCTCSLATTGRWPSTAKRSPASWTTLTTSTPTSTATTRTYEWWADGATVTNTIPDFSGLLAVLSPTANFEIIDEAIVGDRFLTHFRASTSTAIPTAALGAWQSLHLCDKGPAVRVAQAFLSGSAQFTDLAVDGYFGPHTNRGRTLPPGRCWSGGRRADRPAAVAVDDVRVRMRRGQRSQRDHRPPRSPPIRAGSPPPSDSSRHAGARHDQWQSAS